MVPTNGHQIDQLVAKPSATPEKNSQPMDGRGNRSAKRQRNDVRVRRWKRVKRRGHMTELRDQGSMVSSEKIRVS